ncbi:methyltransferase family protein [bacterium]
MKNKRLLPTTYLCAAIVLMVGLNCLPWLKLNFYPWSLLSIIPLLFGIGLNIFADRAFKINETTVKPFEESKVLVTDGVFRLSRNPMYLGFILILFGLAQLLDSFMPFFVIPVFLILIRQQFIITEEKMLEKTFNKSWTRYTNQVRRWL